MNIINELKWRGAINQQTDSEGLEKLLNEKKISLYCGIDPTGSSLHIGHLIPLIVMKRFSLAGYHPYILIGGATGSIGDPSGKKSERKLQSVEQVNENVNALEKQIKKLFSNDKKITFLNNYDWLSKISLLDFLRKYGKLFNLNTMLSKDVVASRLKVGISYTEFTYQMLQSIDFLNLYNNFNIQLEIGGSDQWGNITSGIDLIHRVNGLDTKVYGLTIPLMLKSDGTKFGKTAGGAIWLDPNKTSPYEFYQFWLNQDDKDVIKYLKYFTFLSKNEIDNLEFKLKTEPEKREAQRKLAEEVTRFVHGQKAVDEAIKISNILFSGNIKKLSIDEIEQAFNHVPNSEINSNSLNIVDILVMCNIEPSKRRAREDVINGAIKINGSCITDINTMLDPKKSFGGKYMIVKKGKRKYFLLKIKN